jgi:hypothetical protein
MRTRQRAWGLKFLRNFSRNFVKLQEEEDELKVGQSLVWLVLSKLNSNKIMEKGLIT